MHRLYLYTALQFAMFHGPVIIIFFQSHGLSIREIYILQAVHMSAKLVAEIPAGIFADWFRRRISLLVGCVLVAIAYGGMWMGTGFAVFAIMEMLSGVGRAFMSGADSAYIYDELQRKGEVSDYEKIESTNFAIMNLSFVVYSLMSGYIAAHDISLPYLLSAIFLVFAAMVAASLPEAPRTHQNDNRSKLRMYTLRRALRTILHTELLLMITIVGAIFLFLREINFFTEQPLLSALSVDIKYFGILPAIGAILWAFSSFVAPKMFYRIGYRASLFLAIALSFLPATLLSIDAESNSALVFYLMFYISYGVFEPLLRIISNKVIRDGSERSTILSIQSCLAIVPYCILGPWFGGLLDTSPLRHGFAFLAFCAALGFFILAAWLRLRPKVFSLDS
jgi:MFS family permease